MRLENAYKEVIETGRIAYDLLCDSEKRKLLSLDRGKGDDRASNSGASRNFNYYNDDAYSPVAVKDVSIFIG